MPKVSATAKRRVVISYENLGDDLKSLLKESYPDGYTDYMIRVDKPNGDFFYGVTLEDDQAIYFVKVPVKVDNKGHEEIEKELFSHNEQEVASQIKESEGITDTLDNDD